MKQLSSSPVKSSATLMVSLSVLLLLGACSRQFAISVNEQTLYDPRPTSGTVQVADAGLQTCLNRMLQQGERETAQGISVLSCAGMEVTTVVGISAVSSLQFIDLSNNQLLHLDELAQLRSLRSVNAENNRLNDISALIDINSLTSANLRGNPNIPCAQIEELRGRLQQNLLVSEQCRR